jgi:urease accessory protein UreE
VCWLSIKKLRERFSDFKDAEIRSLTLITPTQIDLTLALQDKARDYDWITLTLHFSDVVDAQLLDENKLQFIDMSEGATLLEDENNIAFATAECYNIEDIKNQRLYIIAKTLKTSESAF